MSDKGDKITASPTTDTFNEKIMDHSERLARLEERSTHLATKEGLAELKTTTKEGIASLKLDTQKSLEELKISTKEDLASLKSDTQKSLSDLSKELNHQTKWFIGALLTSLTVVTGILSAVIAFFSP